MVVKVAQLTAAFSGLKGVLFNQGSTILNSVLIVVTISGEQLFRRLSFKCPCAYPQNIYYGGSFLFAPAFALFLLGILMNQTTWRVMHGCCFRINRTRHGWRRASYYWSKVVSQASVAPLAWLFVAFLDGGYYECYRAGDYCRNSTASINLLQAVENPQMAALISAQGSVDINCICNLPQMASTHLRAYSQCIAWVILVASISIVLTVILSMRCMDRLTFSQNYYINLYREIEKSTFEQYSRLEATELAESNCKAFFDKPRRTKLDWDKISVVPLSEYPHFLDPVTLAKREETYFSPLHEWAKDHEFLMDRWNDTVKHSMERIRTSSLPTVEDLDIKDNLLPKIVVDT